MIRPILATLLLVTIAGRAVATPSTLDVPCYHTVGPLLHASGGTLSSEVRAAYLKWAESTVLNQLKQKGASVPAADCLAEVDHDPAVRDAIFGSVYPPDASILQNYAQIRSEAGPKLTASYRSLVVAMAVARRMKRVETSEEVKNVGQDYQSYFWQTEEPIEQLHPAGTDSEKAFIRDIADFISQSHLSAYDVYHDPSVQQRLRSTLSGKGVGQEYIAQVTLSPNFREPLKNAMVLLGERPAGREPMPSTSAWIHHLTTLYEGTTSSTPTADGHPWQWPLFPLDNAPWPLLMPLSHRLPISESDYMWETFQGEHGDNRLPNYGPYQDDEGIIVDVLRPSRWSWDALPDRIVHGGICLSCSKGTVDLYSALGKPAQWAGQPGHWNLISYNHNGGTWSAEIEQAFAAGPDGTAAEWYFNEDPGMPRFRDLLYWAGAEYHLGLALSMDVSLRSYVDTRIAVNVYKALPASEKGTLGVRLLTGALAVNPFNAEVWYRLAEQEPDAGRGMQLAAAALHRDPSSVTHEPNVDYPQSANTKVALDQYWSTLSQFVTHYAVLDRPAPHSEEQERQIHKFLRGVNGIRAEDIAAFDERFAGSQSGTDSVQYDRGLAESGDTFGELRMGQRLRDGDGVTADDEGARRYFAAAAAQGDLSASCLLAGMYPSIPADAVKVTASSVYGSGQAVSHLVDGSGMTGIVHDNENGARTMWHTSELPAAQSPATGLPASPAWVRFDLMQPAKLESIMIWNHNQNGSTDRGFRTTRIYGSTDGSTWTRLTEASYVVLPQASGRADELPFIVPSTSIEPIKSIVIEADASDGNYGSHYYGLSAVKFVIKGLPNVVPSTSIAVTASSIFDPLQSVQHLIDGSGMVGGFHDNAQAAETMWHTKARPAPTPPAPGLARSPAWARFDFAHPTRFNSILIWNHNQNGSTDRGFRNTHIYGAADGKTWLTITSTPTVEVARAPGTAMSEAMSIPVDLAGRQVKSVIIAADSVDGNYGSSYYGLSAVRFVLNK